MIRCNNCRTNFNNYKEFDQHFTEDNMAECNQLLEEQNLIDGGMN